jgi:hypothetical protein
MSAIAVERSESPNRPTGDSAADDQQWRNARARVAELLVTTDLQDRIDEAFEVEEIVKGGGTPKPSNQPIGAPLIRKGA